MQLSKFWNTLWDKKSLSELVVSLLIATVFTVAWIAGVRHFAPDAMPNNYEIIGTFLNLSCVYLTVRQNQWCWPTGILGVVFFGIAFYWYQLYSTMVLNLVYYFPVQFYGWYCWLFGGEKRTELVPVWSSWKERILTAAGVLVCVWAWGHFLSTYTDAKLVYLDSLVAGMSVVAQFIMSWKRIESWILWITVDVLSVIMFWMVGAYMASALYLIFLCLATSGLISWLKLRGITFSSLAGESL